MYSALRWERPAVRRRSMGVVATREGGGKVTGSGAGEDVGGLNRATNLAFMDFAAAPETWRTKGNVSFGLDGCIESLKSLKQKLSYLRGTVRL